MIIAIVLTLVVWIAAALWPVPLPLSEDDTGPSDTAGLKLQTAVLLTLAIWLTWWLI